MGNTKRKNISKENDFSLLPIARQIAAQTIGLDIVSERPIGSEINDTRTDFEAWKEDKPEEYKKWKETQKKNKSFLPKPKYENPKRWKLTEPTGILFYLDYVYGDPESIDTSTSLEMPENSL
jgi:hypothetical protein